MHHSAITQRLLCRRLSRGSLEPRRRAQDRSHGAELGRDGKRTLSRTLFQASFLSFHSQLEARAISTPADAPLEVKPTRLLTAGEVAALLGVRTSWVYDRARRGGIPHLRLGRHVRFRLEAIEAWIEELEAESTNGVPARHR